MGYDTFYNSRMESEEIWNAYHNRQWTSDQEQVLANRGQPKETFNVIKLFGRMLVGYYSTTVNAIRAEPVQLADQTVASLMTDTVTSIFARNRMETEGDEIKLCGIISGIMAAQVIPEPTGARDQFGRPLYEIKLAQVYDYELVLDPLSTDADYEDARFLHRFKWIPEETLLRTWGEAKTKDLVSHDNFLEIEEADFEYSHNASFQGRYRVFDNYLVVQTVIEDDNGERWEIWWSGTTELERKKITYKEVKWPYRVAKLHKSSRTEYYGIFREVIESQKAINQALVKLQLMSSTQKAFVETNALATDLTDFTDSFNRVNGVIAVKSLKGIRVENLTADAIAMYTIIDKAFDRIQRVLSINDSFLGQAFASDSGRKVKLQQNATIMALRYLTVRIQSFYELLGADVVALVRQYYTAEQTLRVTDEIVGRRFIELNKPAMKWSGEMDEQGQPIMEPMFEQVYNPETGKPEETEEGKLVFAPIPESGSEFAFTEFDITIESVSYNDEDERTQLMLEQVMSGSIGTLLSQVNPAGFFQTSSLLMRTFKTKYSPEVAKILQETAAMLGQNPEDEEAAALLAGNNPQGGQGSHGTDTKLPTNTNEG